MILTPEEMQEAIIKLQEMQKQAEEENKVLKTQLEEKIKREKDLEEHNQKLFLKITGTIEDPEKEKENDLVGFVGEDLYKLLNKKEIELAQKIMNGEDE